MKLKRRRVNEGRKLIVQSSDGGLCLISFVASHIKTNEKQPKKMPNLSTIPTHLSQVQSTTIEELSDFDILCGCKGASFHYHPDNRLFRQEIQSFLPEYQDAKSKRDKAKINQKIVRHFHQKFGSRFLKKTTDGKWTEAERHSVRDKISHALNAAATSVVNIAEPDDRVRQALADAAIHLTKTMSPRTTQVSSATLRHQRRSSYKKQTSCPVLGIANARWEEPQSSSCSKEKRRSFSTLLNKTHFSQGSLVGLMLSSSEKATSREFLLESCDSFAMAKFSW